MAGLQYRKTEAHIYRALQMPQSISGAKPLLKWFTLLLFGVKEEGHSSIQAETLPRHNTPLPILAHPSSSRLPYSGYTLSGICCPLSSQNISPGAGLSEYLGTGAGQAGSLNSRSMEQDKPRDPYLSPTTHHQLSAHTDLCCSQQRFIWHLHKCEIHSGSSQP